MSDVNLKNTIHSVPYSPYDPTQSREWQIQLQNGDEYRIFVRDSQSDKWTWFTNRNSKSFQEALQALDNRRESFFMIVGPREVKTGRIKSVEQTKAVLDK